ncbi:MAG: cytochrome c oxidase assembly protein [Betaproteobacteria bacterium RIFCSPLOWO2_02_67_12]|nr:MAG: cytochrome c oxidase assembly protein [Betaproteobacteria bacterium RIFCSPLOWO2_02_67_12]OGA27498.1 MAG: cytochrome c oxidase assembly protein [Betaproteobacteria bacterium RIFCSPLOWO2_02_FULL_68_150]OGA66128.1 MAG: cytochrome c oxidase assembly protein [Betaproteobacteria bacterium RIFCSPLOWO2_12_FULL_67_28]
MAEAAHPAAERARDNRRVLTRLSVVAALMFGFGFALVPFYEKVCLALGVNSLVERSEQAANTQVDTSRSVTIELDANAHQLPWRFRPLTRHLSVHPGELVHVEYEIANVRSAAVTGHAVPSYGPALAGQYFRKLECFCFKPQTLAAGETRTMPVTFLIDPALPREVHTITLSYTFFEVAGLGGKS